VIPNFLDDAYIKIKLATSADNCFMKNLQKDKPVIISVGRLIPVKGYRNALLAFNKVRKEIPCYYWILGKGSEKDELVRMAKNLGISEYVIFLGFKENPYIFLKQAKVFFLTSQFEGFPNALLEAMYVGLPSVVTRFNSSVEDIIDDGKNGFIIEEKNDVEAMYRALKNLLLNKELYDLMKIKAEEKSELFSKERSLLLLEQYL